MNPLQIVFVVMLIAGGVLLFAWLISASMQMSYAHGLGFLGAMAVCVFMLIALVTCLFWAYNYLGDCYQNPSEPIRCPISHPSGDNLTVLEWETTNFFPSYDSGFLCDHTDCEFEYEHIHLEEITWEELYD